MQPEHPPRPMTVPRAPTPAESAVLDIGRWTTLGRGLDDLTARLARIEDKLDRLLETLDQPVDRP